MKPLTVKNTCGVHERIFCAGNEEGYHFLEQLLDEVADLFPSLLFHIGGDEAPKAAWKSCPRCGKLYQEKGLHRTIKSMEVAHEDYQSEGLP